MSAPVYRRRWAEDAPEAPPHPEPIVRSYRGDFLADAKVWGWTNLIASKVAPGWETSQWRAVGWTMSATGKTGGLVESIAVRMRHEATGARAVGVIHRPLDEETHEPTGNWGSAPGMAWVECRDPACPNAAAVGHPAAGSMGKAGARMLMAALKGEPPLITEPDGTVHWPRSAADDEEE